MSFYISSKKFLKKSIIQEQDNSCVASSVAHGIFIFMNRLLYNSFFPSILFIYYNGRENKEKDEGVYIEHVFEGIQKYGIIPENVFPYNASNLLVKPPNLLYEISKEFPIHFTFQKFKEDEQISILHFIEEHLWNGDLIIADIKQNIDVDHTILIYGIDNENQLLLCYDPQDEIKTLLFKEIGLFDTKDLYSINCIFPNKIPNFILENNNIENTDNHHLNNNEMTNVPGEPPLDPKEPLMQIDSFPYKFDCVIVGGNVAASLCTHFLYKTFKNKKILFLDNSLGNVSQMNFLINDVQYGSYESLDDSSLKYIYELNQDFNIFVQKKNANEEKIIEFFLNDILSPLGLNIESPNINYQIVYCKKLEKLKLSSFETILFENARNENYLNIYLNFLSDNFKGLDLTLPYYVILKIIISPLLSKTKLYIKNYKLFLQKFLPSHNKMKLGTFLIDEPLDNFIYLNTNYMIDENEKLFLFQGNSPKNCYSSKIEISFKELYNTNHFYPINNVHFEPIVKMDLFLICSQQQNNEIISNKLYYHNIIKIQLYGSEVEKIISEKPSNIYMNFIYDISNYKELKRYCNEAESFLLRPCEFSYPITKIPESLVIKKSFGFDNTMHLLNTNFLGSPDIVEYSLNIVELMISFLIDS